MPIGPGKYDDLATHVREQAEAKGVVVLVFGGPKGNGFSVQGDLPLQMLLPDLLRTVAASIERDLDQVAKDICKEYGFPEPRRHDPR